MATKTSDYWQNRTLQLEDALHNKGVKYYHDLERQYQKAANDTTKEINKLYTRLATENNITLSGAKKLLTGNELEEFRWSVEEYIKYGKKNALDQAWTKQLENASLRYRISRLEAMKIHMQNQVEMLMGKEADSFSDVMADIYTEGYYRNAHLIQTGMGVGHSMAKLDTNRISKVLSKPWTADGKNFSERIWGNHRPALINELHTTLTQSIIRGQAPDKAISAIAHKFKVARSKAGNLVMTESAYFGTAAQQDCYKDLDVEMQEFVATLDNHTSDICQSMDGKVFKSSEIQIGVNAPPLHCRCRSVMVPYFEDNITERAARGKDGKTVYIDGNMKYADWFKKFVKGEEKSGISELLNVIKFTDMNKEELNQWVKDYYNLNSNVSLTDAELKALDDYGEGGYGLFNGVERFAKGTPEYERLVKSYGEELVEKAYERSKRLESALSKFKLDQNVELHRAVRDVSYITGGDTDIETLKKMIGQTYTEKGYVSTGLKYQSKFMGTSKNGVHMEILAPKGTNGAYIDKYVAKNEMEFLINKGQKFKILDAGERVRIIKKPKYNLKTHQFEEITEEVTERFMKVQLIAEEAGVAAKTSKVVKAVDDVVENVAKKVKKATFTPAKTIQEAESFARKAGVKNVSFKNVDLEIANDMNKSLAQHFDDFPELKKNINFWGSAQEKKKFLGDVVQKHYENKYASYRESFGSKFVDNKIKKEVSSYFRTSGEWAHAFDHRDYFKNEMFSGIAINKKYGSDVSLLKSGLKRSLESQFHPVGCDTVKSVFDHEFGHQLDYLLDISNNDEFIKIYTQGVNGKHVTKNNLSKYAVNSTSLRTNKRETIAEAWAEYRNNPEPRDIAKAIGELIEKEYERKFGV